MTTTKKLLTLALAASTIAIGSVGVTSEASAKGMKGHHHGWFGHRWYGQNFYNTYYDYDVSPCYFVRKRHGKIIKICPEYFY